MAKTVSNYLVSARILLLQSFQPGAFIRNVATMMAGAASAQALAFIAAPIITRLYTPEHFGVMTFVSSIIAILSSNSCLCYENAIVLPKESEKAGAVLVVSLVSCFAVSSILVIIVAVFGGTIANMMRAPELSQWLWFVPLGIFLFGIWQSLVFFHARLKHFGLLSVCEIVISTTTALVKIIPAFFVGSTALWLITGNMSGPAMAATTLGLILLARNYKLLRGSLGLDNILQAAFEYKAFPLYSVPTRLLNSLSQDMPVLLFAYFFSQNVVGLYGLAIAMLKRPVDLVATSLTKVFFQRSAEQEARGESQRTTFLRTTFSLLLIGVVPFGLLALAGKWIFVLLFGQKWIISGSYAQLLAPWILTSFINIPASQIIYTKQKLRFNFVYNCVSTLVRGSSIIIGAFVLNEPWLPIALFSLSGVFLNIYYIFYAYALTK